jgi:hypothetical protein
MTGDRQVASITISTDQTNSREHAVRVITFPVQPIGSGAVADSLVQAP